MEWFVRRASMQDERELRRLCKSSMGQDDYVLEALNYTLLNETVLVATSDDGSIVGMMSYRIGIDNNGWLGMVRTHPDFRRRGIARSLIEKAVSLAESSGVGHLRFWSDHDNVAANAMAENCGFEEVGWFVRMNASARKGEVKAKELGYDENLWELVEASCVIKKGNGFFCHDWCFIRATRKIIFHLACKGTLRGWNEAVMSFVPEKDRFTDALEIALLAGGIDELLDEGRHQAHKAGIREVSTFIPNDEAIIRTAKDAGYRVGHWGRVAVLYELPVRK